MTMREVGEFTDLLALAGASQGKRNLRAMLGVVTGTGTGNLRVRPDSMPSGDIGPMWRASTYTPAVNDRVLCLYLPDSFAWIVLFKVQNQP